MLLTWLSKWQQDRNIKAILDTNLSCSVRLHYKCFYYINSYFVFVRQRVHVQDLPIHDHGIQCGLARLVRASAKADAAITLLHFTTGTAFLHRIQH